MFSKDHVEFFAIIGQVYETDKQKFTANKDEQNCIN